MPIDKQIIENVSSAVHERWMNNKRAMGITSRQSESGEQLMIPYSELSEPAKDLDRGSVSATIEAIEAAGYQIVPRSYICHP